ncbi:MAG: putative porin, partial [Luteolibacter sp.]
MSLARPILIVAMLGAASLLRAEEVTTETTPVESSPAAEASAALDPSAEAPRPGDLPAEPAPAIAPAAPTSNVTVNLINRLVDKKVLTREEADEMITQAEADAIAVQQAAAAQADIAALPPPPSEDEMRVTYIPEVVKNNMRDQIKQELMAAAREEKWSE